MLGEKLKAALKNAGIPSAKAASALGISEGSLYNIFKKDSFEVSYLVKAAALVGLPVSYFLEEDEKNYPTIPAGDSTKASGDPTQKIKTSKAPSQELAAELAACRRELEVTRALVAAKDETIGLLRVGYTRPS